MRQTGKCGRVKLDSPVPMVKGHHSGQEIAKRERRRYSG